MEFKAAKDCGREELEKLSKSGITQIREKKYITDMAERGIKNIQLYGIAFSGKNVSVETKSESYVFF